MEIKTCAKINLFLDILKKRADSYHEVNMIMQSIDLHDKITITETNKKGIEIKSTKLSIPIEKNIAYISAKNFFLHHNIVDYSIKIKIEKNIPVCGGLAGGSADAAAVLIGLNELFKTNLSKKELSKIGREIGADVPFCIQGGTMLAKGIGTTLFPLSDLPKCYIILVKPDFDVSTKDSYNKIGCHLNKDFKNINEMISAVNDKDIDKISGLLYNVFEKVVQNKEIKEIKKNILDRHALNSCMSGSGPTVFGIFKDFDLAVYCKKILSLKYKDVFLAKPTNESVFISEYGNIFN